MHVVIDTKGSALRMRDGLFCVRKDDQEHSFPAGKVKTIQLTKGVMISTDVLYTCLDQGINVLIVERSGMPVGRLWNNRFGSISTIRRKQLAFSRDAAAVEWVVTNIREKIENQMDLLACFDNSEAVEPARLKQTGDTLRHCIDALDDYRSEVLQDAAPSIRAIEGRAGKAYLQCVSAQLPFRFRFTRRTRHPARDMVNTMLNYSYGILYGHIESALIKAGLDPFIGIFHRDEYRRPVLTYDCIEPFRPWADWVVFHLCINEVMDEAFFEVSPNGWWMGRDARRIVIQHFSDYFHEVIDYRGKRFSRIIHLEQAATGLASHIDKTIA